MKKFGLETVVGLFVLAGILSLAWLSIKLGKMELFSNSGYTVKASFVKSGGVKPGATVEIAGVQVGRVKSVSLSEDYMAVLELNIKEGVKLQSDAIASVKTKGLIGEKYIEITPGGSDKILKDGDKITETESAVDIEELVSKYAFGKL